MLGFILSKMNLLIMVTAIFAIVAYFTFFVGKSVELRESQAMLNNFVESTYGILSSTGQCHQTIISIPPYISSIGTGSVGNRLRFLVRISKIDNPSTGKTTISYAILNRKDGTVLAAKPFATAAQVRLFDWEQGSATILPDTDSQIIINPDSPDPTQDSILLVKEVYLGETFLYMVPCSSENAFCKSNYLRLVDIVKALPDRSIQGGFNCASVPE